MSRICFFEMYNSRGIFQHTVTVTYGGNKFHLTKRSCISTYVVMNELFSILLINAIS